MISKLLANAIFVFALLDGEADTRTIEVEFYGKKRTWIFTERRCEMCSFLCNSILQHKYASIDDV
jgi:hypothetical protein